LRMGPGAPVRTAGNSPISAVMAAVSLAVARRTAPRAPTNRPEDPGLDRQKPHRGCMPYDTSVVALRQERNRIAAGIETAGVSC